MIIVLEGPDGAGKSTLAAEFVRRGFRLAHHDVPPEPGEDKFERYIQLIEAVGDENVIFDRFAPTEYVYSHVLRPDQIQITVEHVRLINRLLYAKGCLTIFCLPPYETDEANWRARHADELVKNPDQMKLIYYAYGRLRSAEYSYLNAIAYDYTRDGEVATHRLLPLRLPRGVIGQPSARFLIVGERSTEKRDYAFLSLKNSSCAAYLNHALWEAGFEEHELAFTNAFTYEGYYRDLRKIYDGRIVIAFGNHAQYQCDEQGVPHLRMFHPQYWKRFQSSRRDEYVAELRKFHNGA